MPPDTPRCGHYSNILAYFKYCPVKMHCTCTSPAQRPRPRRHTHIGQLGPGVGDPRGGVHEVPWVSRQLVGAVRDGGHRHHTCAAGHQLGLQQPRQRVGAQVVDLRVREERVSCKRWSADESGCTSRKEAHAQQAGTVGRWPGLGSASEWIRDRGNGSGERKGR